jgi:drug/metabolite transporter (DMT)-like permease
MLAMKRLTMRMPATMAMAYSSAISAVILLAVVFLQTDVLIPKSVEGWTYLLGLGLVSQLLGQGLIASALTILPVSMSALLLLSAPTSTALFGWLFLGEKMSMGQVISVLVTLSGIGIVALR